jgi:parallel beta-helix repeat protein
MFFVLIFSISSNINLPNSNETTQRDLIYRRTNLKPAKYWNNFTFIHITDLNWTIANESSWCSGSGKWGDPYLIENMIINATDSPIDCGIFIENSTNVFFKIRNVTIFGTTDGIKLENTNNGLVINNSVTNNIDSGIKMINCVNNTISKNKVIDNGGQGIYLFSNCESNRVIRNLARDKGTNLQDTGILIEDYCNDNDIVGNLIYDNGFYGINVKDFCERNLIYNNTLKNFATNQQDYGIRVDHSCHQNNISLNLIQNLNSYGIMLVTSDLNSVTNNQIMDCGSGIYMLIALQNDIIDNIISSGSIGIIMSASDDCNIIRNFINKTGSYAIRLYINCDDNEFYDNIIKDNDNIGIELAYPSDVNNLFYKNSFISNKIHAIDNGTASLWNNSLIGNYWDNYTGIDLNNDNIGDTPFTISGAAKANDSLPIVDHWSPVIIINSPPSGEYGTDAPEFNIFVNETYVYSIWYTINNGNKKYYINKNGTINQNAWSALNDGNITISFYARDIAWKIGSTSIELVKNASQIQDDPGDPDDPDDGIIPPSFDLIPIIVISIIIISSIIIAGIMMRSLLTRRKRKTQRKLNDEQIAKAQYFKDITSIITILGIHKESGQCLSKIAVKEGIGLDEHLFSGFISAIGSFKNELAKQMGLGVREEGGNNIIEYNEFTITLLDGEHLRLGLVSHSNLGDLIKKKSGRILQAYETKHINELKIFDGEIEVFSDFKEIVEMELDMNLSKICFLNMKKLNKHDPSEPVLTILKDLNLRSEEFYPSDIALTLMQKMGISEQEANFIVYEAYENQLLLPKK